MVKCQLQVKGDRIFIVDIGILEKATVIKSMLDDLNIGKNPDVEVDDEVIPLPNVSEQCMEKLIEWCEHHKDDPTPPETSEEDFNFKDEIDTWDQEFLTMDDALLFDIILAANYLDIKGLLDIATTYVARIITDLRTPEEIRKRFNIKNDLTAEDLEEIKKESEHWLEDEEKAETTEEAAGGEASPLAESSLEGAVGGVSLEGAVGGVSLEGAVGGAGV